MKIEHLTLFFAILTVFSCANGKNSFELAPSQSMGMVGQGPGRDGAINPYERETSMAIIKNLGENDIGIRIERPGQPRELFTISPKTKKSFVLAPKDKLFFDSEKATRTKLTFKKYKP